MQAQSPEQGGIEDHGGPYVIAALLCRNITRDQSSNLDTYHQVLDQITQHAAIQGAPERMAPFSMELRLGIKLIAGSARGDVPLRLFVVEPGGQVRGIQTLTATFSSDDACFSLNDRFIFDGRRPGIHWCIFVYGRRVLTRLPLNVVFSPSGPQ